MGFEKDEIILKHAVAMRYIGQSHEVTFDVPSEIARKKLTLESIKDLENIFHEKHKSLYGHASPESPNEFVTLSVSTIGPIPKSQLYEIEKGSASPISAFKKNRRVYFEEYQDYVDCPTFERSRLKAGNEITGPAIIEQMDTTTVVPPDQNVKVDNYGNIIIEVKS
jgi:N-methylhydantoinase A